MKYTMMLFIDIRLPMAGIEGLHTLIIMTLC